MGKRKRTSSALTPSEVMPCSSGRDLTPAQNSSDPGDTSIFERHSSFRETMDNHGRHSNSQISIGQHHYNLSRSMFSKRSRHHHYGNQYSRRSSPNYHKPSTSHGKSTPPNDERLCFKLGSRYNYESAFRPDVDFTEFRERPLWRPERIRTRPSVIDAVPEGMKMFCGICQRSWQKPRLLGSVLSSEEFLSTDAVLVCGHIYHADCLEKKTRPEDIRDPPCPTCSRNVPKTEPEPEPEPANIGTT